MRFTVITTRSLTPLSKLPASASTGLAWKNLTALGDPSMVRVTFYERRTRRYQPPWPLRGNTISDLPSTITTTISPSRYAIELRDKNFTLKQRLEQNVTGLRWEWNKRGGCGRATFQIEGNYLFTDIQADDDVRIYLPNAGGSGATLWYRGYVTSATPSIQGGGLGSIKVECSGYFDFLSRIIVNNSGGVKTYSNQEVSLTVADLIDDFLVTNTSITRGTVEAGTFTPDSLEFKASLKECIETCFNLMGTVEYGVNTSLEFFWYNQVDTIRSKFYLGGNITMIQDQMDFKNIINYVFFEGGDVAGSTLQVSGSASDSITRYGRHEAIVSNGSVVSNSVANQFISALLSQKARPVRLLNVKLSNISTRFEATQPLGTYSIIDNDAVQDRALWGTTANGGSNKLYGRRSSNGSGQLYGGFRREQIDRISYSLSPEDGKVDAEVQFGSSTGFSRSSAVIKQLESIQNTLRQRSL